MITLNCADFDVPLVFSGPTWAKFEDLCTERSSIFYAVTSPTWVIATSARGVLLDDPLIEESSVLYCQRSPWWTTIHSMFMTRWSNIITNHHLLQRAMGSHFFTRQPREKRGQCVGHPLTCPIPYAHILEYDPLHHKPWKFALVPWNLYIHIIV